MIEYSDEKNPWRRKELRKNNTIQEKVFYKHHADGYEEGYLACLKEVVEGREQQHLAQEDGCEYFCDSGPRDEDCYGNGHYLCQECIHYVK